MGDHGAIADAGKTIVELLRDRMTGFVDDDQIVLASPVNEDLKNKVRLTVFLFDIQGNTHHANAEQPPPTDGMSRKSPLRLDLKYLLTAHPGTGNGGTSTSAKTMEDQRVLGRAMQILGDNAIVDGSDLRGSLATGNETLRISVLSETADTVVNVWNTFQGEPYRPSVSYLVTPVEIESRREEPVERVHQVNIEEHVPTGGFDE